MATTSSEPRVISNFAEGDMVSEVKTGLTLEGQKQLPSKYLYDDIGSALFEVICLLPEYGLTRAGMRLLKNHAADIVSKLPGPVLVAELGSGSGIKTRWLLEALSRKQPVTYCPIDISRAALQRCEQELGWIDRVNVVGYESVYIDGLKSIADRRRPGEHLHVLFLGSTIGNFDRAAGVKFLREVRGALEPEDSLLLATDLVKEVPKMLAAYNDNIGVTSAFSLNILSRINREIGTDFDLSAFQHRPRYNEEEARVEAHLVSLKNQTIHCAVGNFAIDIAEGESIWVESSHKFTPEGIRELAAETGFKCESQWIDRQWPFAQNLLVAA